MTVLALALALSAQAPTVTFNSGATTLNTLIPKLAQATNMKLAVEPGMKWRQAYVNVENAPTKEVLDNLAVTMFARWETQNDGTRLLRYDKVRGDKQDADQLLLAKKQLRAYLSTPLPKEEQGDKNRLLLMSILRTLNPDDLLRAIPTRIVYSTSPTRMQRAFPRFDRAWSDALINSHNEGVATQMAEWANQEAEMNNFLNKAPEEARATIKELIGLSKPAQAQPGSASRLHAIWFAQGSSAQLAVKLYDEKGNSLVEESIWVPLTDQQSDVAESEQGEEKEEKDDSPVLTADKKHADFISERSWNLKPDKRKQMQDQIGDLRVSDPWMNAANDMVAMFVAAIPEKNLIIDLDANIYLLLQPKTTVKALKEALLHGTSAQPKGWILGDSDYKYDPMDRDIANEVVTQARAGKFDTLEGRGWLANQHRKLGFSSYRLMQLFQLPTESDLALKIYGALQPDQRSRAQQTGIRFNELPEALRSQIITDAFMDEDLFTPEGAMNESSFGVSMMFDMDKMLAMAKQDLAKIELAYEPTETMPNGFPTDAVISLKSINGPTYLMEQDGRNSFGLDLNTLAMYMSMGEMDPNMKAEFAKIRVRPGQKRGFEVKIQAGIVQYAETIVDEKADDPKAAAIAVTEIPGFAEIYAKQKESMKKWMPLIMDMGTMFGRSDMKGAVPPPN